MFNNCDCGLTGGCEKCRPSFIGCISNKEANKMRKKLLEWKDRFNNDFARRAEELDKLINNMPKNIWEEEFDNKFKDWKNKKFDWKTGEIENIKDFFRQKFVEAFEEIERRSFKDKDYNGFRIIGDETFNEIKEKYIK